MLQRLAEAGLVRGKTVGIGATTLEANAALRAVVRRDTGAGYETFLRQLAAASGIATPTRAELNRTWFPGGSISWEDGVHGKTEPVFTGGTGASGSADDDRSSLDRARLQRNSPLSHVPGIHAPRRCTDVHNDHRDSATLFVGQKPFQHAPQLLG